MPRSLVAPLALAALLGAQSPETKESAASQASRPSARDVLEAWPDGTPKLRYHLDTLSRRSGELLAWHENGKLAERCAYRAGSYDGQRTLWHANGSLALSESWADGKRYGRSLERSADGSREIRASYKDGALHGKLDVIERRRVVATQEWKLGTLVALDGVVPYPKSRDEIAKTLAGLGSAAPPDTPEGALSVLKSYRYLCDLPFADLTLDPWMNDRAAAGAALCARLGKLEHQPTNPGLPPDEFARAFEGTSHSNLAMGNTLPNSVHAYMDDSDPSNIDRVGHRRWCLNPPLAKTGFGKSGLFSAMWAFDESGRKVPKYDAIWYPPRGYVPAGFFAADRAWSVGLNASRFRVSGAADVEIRVRRMDARFFVIGEPLVLENVRVQLEGAGVTPCVIFRPQGIEVTPGSRYWIELRFPREKPERQLLAWLVEML